MLYPKYKISILEDGISALNQAMDSGQITLALYTVFDSFRPHLVYQKYVRKKLSFAFLPKILLPILSKMYLINVIHGFDINAAWKRIDFLW